MAEPGQQVQQGAACVTGGTGAPRSVRNTGVDLTAQGEAGYESLREYADEATASARQPG